MNETWTTNFNDRVIVFQRLTVLGTKWRYQVIAANGELVEHGESYSRRIDALAAAERHHPRVGEGQLRSQTWASSDLAAGDWA